MAPESWYLLRVPYATFVSLRVGEISPSHPGKDGKEFCSRHFANDSWKVHGRVDGPIPESHLQRI